MKESKLCKYYDLQVLSFESNFGNTVVRQSRECIHQLRISIKKLNTVWQLTQEVCQLNWEKNAISTLISEVFEQSGRIRDYQVSLTLLEKLQARYLYPLKKYLGDSEKVSARELAPIMQSFDMENFYTQSQECRRVMLTLSNKAILDRTNDFINVVRNKLKSQILIDVEEMKLHKIRMQLRLLQEILIFLFDVNPLAKSKGLLIAAKRFNQMIGKWHDQTVLVDFIYTFTNNNPANQSKYLDAFVNRLTSALKIEERRIHQELTRANYLYA